MAITDKTITIRGAQAVVTSVALYPQPDGKVHVVVHGEERSPGGGIVPLDSARQTFPAGVAILDNMLARALRELRLANGLET